MKKIALTVNNHHYDIVVGNGLMPKLHEFIDLARVKGSCLPVVIDKMVDMHHGKILKENLQKQFPDKEIIWLPIAGGEASKSLNNYADMMEKILATGLERHSWLVAIGGGVVGDLAGFCAATVLRGIAFIQVPTSLLAMVDSSVGGKVGINSKVGKNLIGAFHQPHLVLADIDFLKTLPAEEISAGIAEIIKYGAIVNEEFFAWLEENMEKLIALDANALSYAIEESVKMKSQVVMKDEKESSWRMVLNFGHTFAHAIEAEYQYKPLSDGGVLHGQAVGLGMLLAARFSEHVGRAKNISVRLEKILQRAKLPTNFSDLPAHEWDAKKLLTHMQHDKKVSDKQLVFVLLNAIGEVAIDKTITTKQVEDFLSAHLL